MIIQFETNANDAIQYLSHYIESNDTNGEYDIDFVTDGLDINTCNGVYTIRKQNIISEIWITSPISGPYHFAYKDGKWINKNKIDLFNLLFSETIWATSG